MSINKKLKTTLEISKRPAKGNPYFDGEKQFNFLNILINKLNDYTVVAAATETIFGSHFGNRIRR